MATDYFTRTEFREYAKDPAGPNQRYDDADIDRAQAEVIEHLEQWARSAWPNVTGADGDGTALAARSAVELHDARTPVLTRRAPIIAVSVFTNAGIAVTTDLYDIDLASGIIWFKDAPAFARLALSISYTFGFTSCPWSIKRPVMKAAKSLMDGEEQRGRIPAGTRQYTSERTTIVLNDEEPPEVPWNWDEDASEAVRTWWGPRRPTQTIFV